MNIKKLLSLGKETDCLDYKEKNYDKFSRVGLVKDVVAFANSKKEDTKYIVIGVKQENGKFIPCGIDQDQVLDRSFFDEIILENIEPDIDFSVDYPFFEGKQYAVISIYSSFHNRPFMIKKDIGNYNQRLENLEGTIYIRKGATNKKAHRSDLDEIFIRNQTETFDVRLTERQLFVEGNEPGKIELNVYNGYNRDFVFEDVELRIIDENKRIVYRGSMCGGSCNSELLPGSLDTTKPLWFSPDQDFHYSIQARKQQIFLSFFPFGSSAAVACHIDEDGYGSFDYVFEFSFFISEKEQFNFKFKECNIFCRGPVLHKVARM